MKIPVYWLVIAAFGLAMLVSGGVAYSQDMYPPDFQFKQTGPAVGPSTFSHKTHIGKKLQCTDCHVKVFQMKKGTTTGGKPMTMADMMAGKYCGTCHNGKKAFATTDCLKCHAPPKK